jgi:Zn-dependent protease
MMNYSWKLGRLCGIDIRLHWSFLIVPAWVALSSLAAGATLATAVNATLFILAIFGCVLLHEMGHALAARCYGIATHDITLLPIGGLARLDGMTRSPRQEMMIALAGPAVNFAIAGALWLGLLHRFNLTLPAALSSIVAPLLAQLLFVNLSLGVFNLLPAFPMDGGRVVRAILASFLSYERATQIAARLGQGLALALAVIGLFGNLNVNLMLIAAFVFLAARSEANAAASAASAPGQAAANAMPAPILLLPAHARANDVTRALFAPQSNFPVVLDGEVVGIVPKAALLSALAKGDGYRPIAELMIDAHLQPPHIIYESANFPSEN